MTSYDDIYGGKYLSAANTPNDRILTVKAVTIEAFEKTGEKTRRKAALWFDDEERALILNTTNAGTMASTFGKDFSAWVGREIEVRNEPVFFAGKMVPSLRVYPKRGKPIETLTGRPPSDANNGGRAADMDDSIPF